MGLRDALCGFLSIRSELVVYFSLKESLVVVGVICLALAALVDAQSWIANLVAASLAVLIVVMLIRAIVLTGSHRAVAVGFVCATIPYVLFATSNHAADPDAFSTIKN